MVIETTPKARADLVLGEEYSTMHADITGIPGMLEEGDLVRFTRVSGPPAPETARVVIDLSSRVVLRSQDGTYWMLKEDRLAVLEDGDVSEDDVQVRGLVVEG